MSDPVRIPSRPELHEKVAFLKRPESYPTNTRRVEAVETHMSWVFLTDQHAWKLKKPVQTTYLDFSTPQKRFADCQEEVRLNRRLAPDVYLGVVPLTIHDNGSLAIGGSGDPVDWLVQMRRLPQEQSLDRRLQAGTVDRDDVLPAAELLTRFYQRTPAAEITFREYRARMEESLVEDQRELSDPGFGLPQEDIDRIAAWQRDFLRSNASLLADRLKSGKVIEAHGDLRPDHIWLGEAPTIIDCLEFNRDLRTLDMASELAYLALECDRLFAARIGDLFFSSYSERTGDAPEPVLLDFYRRQHALTRARLAVWHLRDDGIRQPDQWTQKGARYLKLALVSRYSPLIHLGKEDAVIVVDVQKDFCPGGSLAVRECAAMIEVLNRWLSAAHGAGSTVVASRDWHPADHASFRDRGGPWPPHCIQDTAGARFCETLHLPQNVHVVSKGTARDRDSYSAFENTGLADWLRGRSVRRVWIGGLVQEVCVRATALDALHAGFDTYVIQCGTEPIHSADGRKALIELQQAGATIV